MLQMIVSYVFLRENLIFSIHIHCVLFLRVQLMKKQYRGWSSFDVISLQAIMWTNVDQNL